MRRSSFPGVLVCVLLLIAGISVPASASPITLSSAPRGSGVAVKNIVLGPDPITLGLFAQQR
jgi:hypothetical protein